MLVDRKVDVGTLFYDGDGYEVDDRTLVHLQLAISTKLRRRESFFLTWAVPIEQGSGMHTIWIDNGIPIHFYYSASRPTDINRAWLEALVVSSGRSFGAYLIPEAGLPDVPADRRD